MSAQPDPNNPGYDTDGHPLVKGVVGAVIEPIVFKAPNQGDSVAGAVGVALDANGNPIDQSKAPTP